MATKAEEIQNVKALLRPIADVGCVDVGAVRRRSILRHRLKSLLLSRSPLVLVEGPTGTVVVALSGFGTETLDPGVGVNETMAYYGAMFDWFIAPDASGQPPRELGALNNWAMSADGKTWTLTFREGMRWHDGQEVTAEDGKFSIERYAASDATCAMCGVVSGNLASATVVSKYVFDVRFKEPNPFFVSSLMPFQGDMPILPKHHWAKVGGSAGFVKDPLGSGPYKFSSRKIGEFIELRPILTIGTERRCLVSRRSDPLSSPRKVAS